MRDGFAHGAFGASKPGQLGEIITLDAGERRDGLVMRLQPLGAISGVVTDSDGDPLIGAHVQVLELSHARGKPSLRPIHGQNTNDRGEYRMFGLAARDYYVLASHRTAMPGRLAAGMGYRGQGSHMYAPQFYPRTAVFEAATPVKLAPGADIGGIDLRLELVPVVRARGRVMLPANLPPNAYVNIQAIPRGILAAALQRAGLVIQRTRDEFELLDALPGQCLLVATASSGKMQYRGVVTVELGPLDKTEIEIPLQGCTPIEGRVVVEGDAAPATAPFRVYLVPGDDLPVPGAGEPDATTDPNLRFRLPCVLPGVWDIGIEPVPKGGYLKAMYLGDLDVLAEEMVIGPDAPPPLQIVLSTRGARLTGRVESDPPLAQKQVTALLVPQGCLRPVLAPHRIEATREDGRFEMAGLRPGSYKLFAFESFDVSAWLNPDFLKPFESFGVEVELAEGESAESNVPLIPEGTGGSSR
jgi:hypothetical protein